VVTAKQEVLEELIKTGAVYLSRTFKRDEKKCEICELEHKHISIEIEEQKRVCRKFLAANIILFSGS
jgi:hypothetical protein